jgi:hypothetical protein
VALSALPLAAFTLHDFQGYPDVYPLLPYSALGFGALVAAASARAGRVVSFVALAAAAALAGFAWHVYATSSGGPVNLKIQEQRAAATQQILGPTGRLYALGDPTSLVLTHRRNPDRYIYLGSGVMDWKLRKTPGRYNGWLAQIRRDDPGVIVIHTFTPTQRRALRFLSRLHQGYVARWLGGWELLVKPQLFARARAHGVVTARLPPAGHSALQPASQGP